MARTQWIMVPVWDVEWQRQVKEGFEVKNLNEAEIVSIPLQGELRDKAITSARNYAAADRTDPFTFARCMTHINNGIVGHRPDKDGHMAMYSADEFWETRHLENGYFSDGSREYQVRGWKNISRP